MLNANANAGGNGKPVFTYVKYTKQYLDPEPRQKIDYYVNDWENYKKTENEKGIYVEFEDKYVEEGNVKYKKIKRQFPMSEYKKEIDDLNKSSDLNKSNVSENASVNPENNVVLTLKDEEKDEKKETIEIRAGKNKNDAESAKEEKDNNKDEIVKKEIIKIKNNETHIITEEKGDEKGEIKGNNSESDSSEIINNVDGNEVNKSNNNIVMLTDGNNNDQHLETNNQEKNEKDVNSNESVNPENNVVLTLELGNKEKEKGGENSNISEVVMKKEKENRNGNKIIEKEEIMEIRVEENKNNEESAKGEKDNNKDKIVEKEIIKIKNNETHIITEEKGEKEEEIEENNSLKLDKTSITFTLNKLEIKNSGNGKEIDGLNQNNVREDEYDKEDGNDEGEENDSKTEIVNLATLDIASLVKNSESFADFCNKLTETYKGIDLNKLDFRPVKLRFLNYCKAFFWTCVDLLKALFGIRKMNVDCGILLLTRLRVFFENAKFEGKTYCFEVPKTGNTQSHHSNKAQYEQNIDWLSSQIEKTKEQASKKPPGIDSNSRNLVK